MVEEKEWVEGKIREMEREMKKEGTLQDYLISVVPIGKRNAQTSAEIFLNYAQDRATRGVVRASLSALHKKGLIQSEAIGSGQQRLYWKEWVPSKGGIIGWIRRLIALILTRKGKGD